MDAQVASTDGGWLRASERGSTLGIIAVVWFARVFGRTGARALLRVVALYYAIFGRRAVRASRDYLGRVHGRVGFWMVYRHILRFTQVALDRVYLVSGRLDKLETTHEGHEHLRRLEQTRTGAILLGAHLGSFEAMRALGKSRDLTVNVVVHFENARRINAFLQTVNPDFMQRVIEIRPGDTSFIFKLQERIEAGEMVAILGDRTGLGERSVEVPFFGAPARFPTGPFTLAAALKCPLYLTFGLHHPPNRYALYCEPFAERLELPRKTREHAVRAQVQRWAERLEHYCRKAPDNWFNFYEFWNTDDAP